MTSASASQLSASETTASRPAISALTSRITAICSLASPPSRLTAPISFEALLRSALSSLTRGKRLPAGPVPLSDGMDRRPRVLQPPPLEARDHPAGIAAHQPDVEHQRPGFRPERVAGCIRGGIVDTGAASRAG